MSSYPPIYIVDHWAAITDHLCELVDSVPEGKMEWSPTPKQWNFRGLFLHIAGARHHWLANVVHDGEVTPDMIRAGRTDEGLKQQLRLSWERMERFLLAQEKLAATYVPPTGDPEPEYEGDPSQFDGHFIAYHRLVHDVHHRADVMHYLALLDVDVFGPEVPSARRRPL